VRRDHIYIRQGVFWILVAVASVALGAWPTAIDRIGESLGVSYPPTLLLLAAILVLMIKGLLADIGVTKLRRDMRRLNQRIALLEADANANRGRSRNSVGETGDAVEIR